MAEEKLLLTPGFLATGMSQKSLSFAFRIDKSTVEKFFAETCQAICDPLEDAYLRTSNTPNDWLYVFRNRLKIHGIFCM